LAAACAGSAALQSYPPGGWFSDGALLIRRVGFFEGPNAAVKHLIESPLVAVCQAYAGF
jgi:hypothetical protein